MTISTYSDPTKLPNQSQDQATFDGYMAQFFAFLPAFVGQVNAEVATMNTVIANLNSIAAGGAYAMPYVLDTATADADPGAGKLRFNQVIDQSSSGFLYVDEVHAGGANVSGLLDTFNASTSAIKGRLRLVKLSDPSRYLTFNVTSVTAAAGYRKIAISGAWGSSPSPFINGDALILLFDRTGDMGAVGPQGLNGRDWVLADTGAIAGNPVNIDYLNLFSDSYDSYTIEFEALRPSASATQMQLRFAIGGVVTTTNLYSAYNGPGSGTNPLTLNTQSMAPIFAPSTGIGTTFGVIGRTHIRNSRNGAANAITTLENSLFSSSGAADAYLIQYHTVAQLGNKASGFRLFWNGGQTFAGGRIRVIGHRNN